MATKKQITKKTEKKSKKRVEHGRIYIKAQFNNTIISITDNLGNVLKQLTPAALNYKHCRKNTPSAIQETMIETAKSAIELFGMKVADVILNGPGLARDMIHFLGIYKGGESLVLQIASITDTTSIPHGGCRQKREAKR